MIRKAGNEAVAVTARGRMISAVRKGAAIVWQAVRSCFGRGWWTNDRPWSNTEGWKRYN